MSTESDCTSVFGIGWFGYTKVVYGDYVGYKPKAVDVPVTRAAYISEGKGPLTSKQLGTRMKATSRRWRTGC